MTSLVPGLYCEHGVYVTLGEPCRHGCAATVPLCIGCGHEPHMPHHCVMLVDDPPTDPDWVSWRNCACGHDSYAEMERRT